jgi:hypothetical protein
MNELDKLLGDVMSLGGRAKILKSQNISGLRREILALARRVRNLPTPDNALLRKVVVDAPLHCEEEWAILKAALQLKKVYVL